MGPTPDYRVLAGPTGPLNVAVTAPVDGATPVLFLHGINMSHDVWLPVLQQLPATRGLVIPDLRGHGRSGRAGPFGPADYAADALAVLDSLGIARAHVVGTSFGGSVACVLAAEAPERVASLTAIGSALKAEGVDVDAAVGAMRAIGLRAFFEAFLPQASFAPGTAADVIERAVDVATDDRTEDVVIDVSRAAFAADVTVAAQKVDCPALVVVGEYDATCPPPFAEAMAAALRAELVLLPGRGHVVTYEDPAGVATVLARHLDKAEAGAPASAPA